MDIVDMSIGELETALARAQAACDADVASRSADNLAKADRLRGEIAKLRTLQLEADFDTEFCATAAIVQSTAAFAAHNTGHGGDVGALSRGLYQARAALASLIPSLEKDVRTLSLPAYPSLAFSRSIGRLESEISKRKNAKAARLETLRGELAELGVEL